jgi:hypothetical protein
MTEIVRTVSEIEAADNEAAARVDEGSRYPAMSYEEGVRDALRWVTDADAPHPLED